MLMLPFEAVLPQPTIPEALEPWRDWVLFGQEFRGCSVLNGRDTDQQANYICAWPGELEIDVNTDGARFEQTWTLDTEEWVFLPGDSNFWPAAVTVDGEPRAVVRRSDRPRVRLTAGEHLVTGELRWETRPASLPVPVETGLVDLTLDGAVVDYPELERGVLWLGLRPDLVVEQDRLTVQVYRRLADEIPLKIETRIELDVAGQSRELELTGALLSNFVGESLDSELPAELDPDGTLRMQIRPGRWNTTLVAHHPEMATTFQRPERVEPWPEEEIWSFDSNPSLRVAALEGAPAIDSARAGVPFDWESLPSFVVANDQTLTLVERSRNDASDANRLSLNRLMWLDFDGQGYTTQDRVSGDMRSGWRLDMAPPYTMTMAAIGDDNLLVTEGTAPGNQGVEIREPSVNLRAVARLASSVTLPVTGYTETFDQATTRLYLPPAYRLVAAPGADEASRAWIERWRLLDIFLAMIIAIAAWRLLGNLAGGIALVTMVLVFHEPWAPHYAWLNLLLIIALVRVVPEGRIRYWCQRYRQLSVVALLLLLIPFVTVQLRDVVFPQLERSTLGRGVASGPAAGFGAGQPISALVAGDQAQVAAAAARSRAFSAAEAPQQVIVTGARIPFVPNRYLPGELVQTGPGLPDWAWNRYDLEFNGPISETETFRVIVIGPWLVGLWRIASVAAALGLVWLLIHADQSRPRAAAGSRGRSAAAAGIAAVLLLGPQFADAQQTESFPSPQLLNELRLRLTDPAPCHPECAELAEASVTADQTTLTMALEIAVQDRVAVPIPGRSTTWMPQTVTVDGSPVTTIFRTTDGEAWIPLDAGVHRVTLEGLISATNSLTLAFPLTPRRIAVTAPDWDVAGVADGRLPSSALELIRQSQADEDAADTIQSTSFPAFVRVTRFLEFDIDWQVSTEVQRIAPADLAFTIPIDLLPNESVVTADIEVEGNTAMVAFGAGESMVFWESSLPITETLTLSAPEDAPWAETWYFTAHQIWHVEYDGLPATPPNVFSDSFYRPQYLPRPGESLTVTFARPEPVSGDTIAIDDAIYARSVGERASNSNLSFSYRSTRAVEHPVILPVGSELESVTIDGQTVPLELDGTTLSLPVTPGEHQIVVNWRNLEGIGLNAAVTPVNLGAGASNITTVLNLPGDRWTLLTYGPTLGPAVLYWAELAVFVLAAFILGRIAVSPLRTHEWLLLGLGLSTFSWPVLFLFAAWAFLMSYRSRHAIAGHRYVFNLWQIVLSLITLGTVVALISSIENGLLGSPNMHIVSPVRRRILSWFLDRSDGATPNAGAISVSLWFYKAAMLAWALWLSFAVLRWLRWAWTAISFEGIWRGKVKAKPNAA